MIDLSNVIDITLGNETVTQIEDSLGNVLWSAAPAVEYFYVEDVSGFDNTLTITCGEGVSTFDVYESTDQQNWTLLGTVEDGETLTATVPANGKLYLKATTDQWSDGNYYNQISCTDNFNIGGSIMSLLRGDNYNNATFDLTDNVWAFYNLFSMADYLIDASDLILPSNTADNCYNNMFSYCISLTTPPVLPATTLTEGCYAGMFNGCDVLTTAPALPATTLADYCYNGMFSWCTSLTTAPALPATTMGEACYQGMFSDCTSLATAPALPATTMANYCYSYMFAGCSSLDSITTYADDISASDCISFWLDGVAATGDFYNLGSAVYIADDPSGIPSGWTEHTSL